MRRAALSAGPSDPRAHPARRVGRATLRALLVAFALAALELAPAWARAWGWAPRADFSARFAWLPTPSEPGCPANLLRAAVAVAAERRPAGDPAGRLAGAAGCPAGRPAAGRADRPVRHALTRSR